MCVRVCIVAYELPAAPGQQHSRHDSHVRARILYAVAAGARAYAITPVTPCRSPSARGRCAGPTLPVAKVYRPPRKRFALQRPPPPLPRFAYARARARAYDAAARHAVRRARRLHDNTNNDRVIVPLLSLLRRCADNTRRSTRTTVPVPTITADRTRRTCTAEGCEFIQRAKKICIVD
ncbi:Hypothetical protein CINCED_3A024800 [Cinara cedri]|uniref:Uncharacterized protein n=1 Tax=Cinara cedri TaxID=506608 RepID=A0A5E4N4Z0_9HEMI|nr:Hypothetical protein CINCED_3A024800 [Cinara cedri]